MNDKAKNQEEWREFARSKTGRRIYLCSAAGMLKIINTKDGSERITPGVLNRWTGYRTIGVWYSQIPVHTVVLKCWGSPKPNDGQVYECHHKNSIKTDNRVENLEWISRREHGKSEHKLEMLRKHRVCTQHKNEVLRAEKDGVVKFYENGPLAARDIGCSTPLVYNAINKHQSARRAFGWTLQWVKKDDVPKGAIIQRKLKRRAR